MIHDTSDAAADGRVLRQVHGQMQVGLVVFALTAVGLGSGTVAAFADDSTWLEYPLLLATIFAVVAFARLRKRAYLISGGESSGGESSGGESSGDQIAERSGFLMNRTTVVRLDDVLAVTWHRSGFPRRAGCVLWATSGGHRRGLQMWPINDFMTTEVRKLRRQLESQHDRLGAMLVDQSSLSPDDSAAFVEFLRNHRFAPLPSATEASPGMVSYPQA